MEPSATSFDLIFFAILAVVIGFKLFTVLGRKDDGAPPQVLPPQKDDAAEKGDTPKLSSVPDPESNDAWPPGMAAKLKQKALPRTTVRKEPEPVIADDAVAKALADIRAKDANFSAGSFVAGARGAFEMLLKALQEGDRMTLKNLLSAEVYKDFASEIDRREKEGKFPQTTLVAIRKADIVAAELQKFQATVEMEFTTEQIHVIRDAEKKIIGGDPSGVVTLTERWTFERDLRSGNPNWTIVAT